VTAVFDSLEKLLAAPPLDLGATGWIELRAQEVSDFVAATGSPSPYLAVSLTNRFLPELLQVPAASSGVNYGAESIELGPLLEAGQRVRAAASLVDASEVKGGVQTTVEVTIEVDQAEEPACTVRSLSRWLA
jgi:acyl dehydratase